MEPIAISISILSLAIAMWAAARSDGAATRQLRLSRRAALHKRLHDIEVLVLEQPHLFRLFRSCPEDVPARVPTDAERWVLFGLYLNLFEEAAAMADELRRLDRREAGIAAAWDSELQDFLDDAIDLDRYWARYGGSYYPTLRARVEKTLAAPAARTSIEETVETKTGSPPTV